MFVNDDGWEMWKVREISFLDEQDLMPFLKPEFTPGEIMDRIEDKLGETFRKISPGYEEEEYIFNRMDEYDFMKYMEIDMRGFALLRNALVASCV